MHTSYTGKIVNTKNIHKEIIISILKTINYRLSHNL